MEQNFFDRSLLTGRPMGNRLLIKVVETTEVRSGIVITHNEELQRKIIVEIVQVGNECTLITKKDIGKQCVIFNLAAEWYVEFDGGKNYGEIGETEVMRLLSIDSV